MESAKKLISKVLMIFLTMAMRKIIIETTTATSMEHAYRRWLKLQKNQKGRSSLLSAGAATGAGAGTAGDTCGP